MKGVGAAVATAALVVSSGTAVAVPRAQADATWGPVTDLALSPSISRPDVVVDQNGNTTVVWRTLAAIIAIRQNAAGVWGDPRRLGRGTAPEVGVDGAGTVTAVWTRQLAGQGPQVMTARRPVGGRWSAASPVSAPVDSQGNTAHGAFDAHLAVSNDGAVLVSWLWGADDSGASRIQARYRPAGHGWHGIATLSPVEARSPVCAIGNHGRAVVVYTRFGHVFAAERSTAGWSPRREIGAHAEPPQVAMDDAGDVTAVWSAFESDGIFRPQAVTRRIGGAWSPPHTLDASLDQPLTAPEPVITSGPGGNSTAAWVRPSGQVVVSDHPLGGSWSRVKQVAPTGDRAETVPPYVDITAGRSGSMLLTWTRDGGSSHYIEGAYRPAQRSWQQPVRISPAGVDASAAETFVRTGDRAVAAWRAQDSDGAHLQLRKLHP